MKRDKPYYSKKQIINCIENRKIQLEPDARQRAKDDFGWKLDDIKKALKKLSPNNCYKSEQRFENPGIWVDYYRADVMGEQIYTHFYIDETGQLIIDSFKKR